MRLGQTECRIVDRLSDGDQLSVTLQAEAEAAAAARGMAARTGATS